MKYLVSVDGVPVGARASGAVTWPCHGSHANAAGRAASCKVPTKAEGYEERFFRVASIRAYRLLRHQSEGQHRVRVQISKPLRPCLVRSPLLLRRGLRAALPWSSATPARIARHRSRAVAFTNFHKPPAGDELALASRNCIVEVTAKHAALGSAYLRQFAEALQHRLRRAATVPAPV